MSEKKPGPPAEDQLTPAVGAVLFASGESVPTREITEAFGGVDPREVEEAAERLQAALDRSESGLRVERVAGGYRLATRPEVAAWVRHFMRQRNRARLTSAGLETLAIIAYRQPVTVPEIQAIRGKDPSAAVKNLLEKKLVRILGKKRVVGNPLLYGTSKQFLVHFGLNSLDDLPSIEEFDEFVGALVAEAGGGGEGGADATEGIGAAHAGEPGEREEEEPHPAEPEPVEGEREV